MFGFKKKKVEKENKITKHQEELIKQFEDGMILQVDGKTDNKEYFKNINHKKEEAEEEEALIQITKEELDKDLLETNLDDLPEIKLKEEVIENE